MLAGTFDARHAISSMTQGSSFPLGATVQLDGVNFSVFSKHATAVQLVLFDRVDAAAPARVIDLDPRTQRSYHYWHAFVPGIAAGSVLRLPRRRAVRPVPRASFRPRQGPPRSVRTVRGAARGVESSGGPAARRQLRLGLEERGHGFQPLSLGGRPAPAHAVRQNGGVRDARRGLHPQPQLRRAGVAARHLSRRDRQDSVPAGPGCHRRRTAARLRLRRPGRAGRPQRLGLSAGVVLRTPSRLQREAGPARRARRLPRHGEGAAPRRHRGHPRRGLQPHHRSRRGRTDHLLPRVRQRHLLHPRRERAVVCRLQRVRQHPERQPVDRAAADSRQPPLLGDRDARGRLPLRSRLDPVARRAGQADGDAAPAVGHRVGPGVRQRQADRRSLGRGRPLSGRPLRRRQLDGMERQVSRRRAGVPEGRRGNGARTRTPADRQPRRLRARGARGGAEHQLRHLPRWLHA